MTDLWPGLRLDPPTELPISAHRADLVAAIAANRVVVVAGSTGSGKSTQLPKLCLEAGRGRTGMIGHTQPRRIAARSVAERIAAETGTELGDLVGYTVRFTDRVRPTARIKVMTDGILLAELTRDRLLRRYDTIIVDEAHERSLNVDVLLGSLHRLLAERDDLHVVITSATIDTDRFAAHFGGAPVIEVGGRSYPVEVRYRPPADGTVDQPQAIVDAVTELWDDIGGDVLVFCSGEREIRDAADALRTTGPQGAEILPLYARLTAAEQHRVFAPHRDRRIVLATNVAETSLTVPGIRSVVDPGTARISRYSHRSKVQRLPIEAVSQASADQRAGRCGRVGPGICIRLYDEDDFAGRPAFTEPEILRTNLAAVVLRLAALGLGEVADFPFLEPPDPRAVRDGVGVLVELGALDPDRVGRRGWLTPLGRRLADLPVDPRLGRMILEADRTGAVHEVIVIAAALSIQDPRERPPGDEAAAAAHRRFDHPDSDVLAYVALWDHVRELQRTLSSSAFRRRCRAEHLHHLRIREWQDLVAQLRTAATRAGLHVNRSPADTDSVHRALLAGLLAQVGRWDPETRRYRGTRSTRFDLARSSVLARRQARWVMVAELVETDRLRGRTAARIRPEWIEHAGAHLVRRTAHAPEWDRDRGAAMATETVTLLGLPVVDGRRVHLARIDPDAARAHLLHHALVGGEWDATHEFVARNAAAIEEVAALEHRCRRTDLLADEVARYAFFDAVVPARVTSVGHFDRWWRDRRHEDPLLLDLPRSVLLDVDEASLGLEGLPTTWHHDGIDLEVRYRFAPGADDDGVTVVVPLVLLGRMADLRTDWHVPGHRAEVVATLLRGLPKTVRRELGPAPDAARAILAEVGPEHGPLVPVLRAEVRRRTGLPVEAADLDPSRLPPHLRVRIAAVDADGDVVDVDHDVAALGHRLRGRIRSAVAGDARSLERRGARRWEFGTLPERVVSTVAGHDVVAYPALYDEGDAIGVRVLADAADANRLHWAGTRRLLALTVAGPTRAVDACFDGRCRLALALTPFRDLADLRRDCVTAALDELLVRHGGPVRDPDAFEALRDHVQAALPALAVEVATTAARLVVSSASVARRIEDLRAEAMRPSVDDARRHLRRLLRPGVVTETGAERLGDLARWIAALDHRLERLPRQVPRDRERVVLVTALEAEVDALLDAAGPTGILPAHAALRRMLEELRVSLFAEAVGALGPVSERRVRAAIEELRRA